MAMERREFAIGALLTATAMAGCVEGAAENENGGDENGGDGNGDEGGADEPTTAIPEEPRVDEPPYEIEEQPDDGDEWNPLFLCEHVSAASELEFRMVSAPELTDPLLSVGDHDGAEYAVRVLTGAAEVREVFDVGGTGGDGDEPAEPIDAIDFESYVVLVIESGYGSSSITHHWKRAESTDRGVRLHGCYRKPYVRTADVSPRHSVVRVERPDEFEVASVSLTVGEERRVHFNSTEGVVSVDHDG